MHRRAASVEKEGGLGQVNANQKGRKLERSPHTVQCTQIRTYSNLDTVPVPELTCPCPFLLWVIIFSLPTHNTHTRVSEKQWLSFKEGAMYLCTEEGQCI